MKDQNLKKNLLLITLEERKHYVPLRVFSSKRYTLYVLLA